MPRLRTLNTKKAPEGWDDVLPQLEEFQSQMRDAVNEPHEGKRRNEATWPITKIHYERSRYIYELYYTRKAISRELYDYLLREKYADAALIAKWKKPGYEYLCSLQAIDKRNSNFGTTSICRVPLHLRKSGQTLPSVTTGCISCASQEAGRLGGPIWWDTPRPADLVAWAKAGCPTADKPPKKRKVANSDDELEARALALRRGAAGGTRDKEAAELEAVAAAIRGVGTSLGTPNGDPAPPTPPDGFQPSSTFEGARPGWAFKMGPQGLGYYLDPRSDAAAPPPAPPTPPLARDDTEQDGPPPGPPTPPLARDDAEQGGDAPDEDSEDMESIDDVAKGDALPE